MKASKITAVDFFDDLASPYARRWFLSAFVMLCAVSATFIYFVSQFVPDGTLNNVITTVFTAIIANSILVIAFYLTYFFFIGPNTARQDTSVTRPQDIRECLKILPLDVSRYVFWGRSGSFFRVYPLLELDRQARQQKKNIDIEIVLPDPTDSNLLALYGDLLRALGESSSNTSLLEQVLATLISCAVVNANNRFLNVRVFFSNFLPGFRVDLSDNGGILTQDDPSKSALFFKFQSEFYEMLRTTIRNEMSVSKAVHWDEDLFKGRALDARSCDKDTLNAFGIDVKDVDVIQERVATLITQRSHRYK